jgi:O-antigen/teichoic acid export membrane protein
MKAIQAGAARLWHAAAGTELRRDVLETYAVRLFVVAITFATAVVVTRQLGPSGRGLYAVAVTIGAIGAQFGNIGLHASNMYYVAKDRALLPALTGNTLAVSLLMSIPTALSGIALVLWPKLAPVHGTLLFLALASVPAGLLYQLTQGLLLGASEVRAYNKIEYSSRILALALIGILAFAGFRAVEPFYFVTLAAAILSFVWAIVRLRKVSPSRPMLSLTVFRQSIGVGLRAYLIAFFGFLVLRIDLLMVKYMLGATEAGFYSISQVLSENTMMFPVVVGLLLFPKLSGITDRQAKLRLANKAVLATAALMLPAVSIAPLIASPLISIAFGRTFLPAVAPFAWLMPGTFFLGLETVMVQLLNSEGFPTVIIVAWIADTVVNVALNLWAIPRYGISGASIVSSVCYFLMFLMVFAVVRQRHYARRPVPAGAPDLRPA